MGQLLVSFANAISQEQLTMCRVTFHAHTRSDWSIYLSSAFHLTDGSDYVTVDQYNVTFIAGQQNTTVMVTTVDDTATELSEYFKVVISAIDSTAEIGSPNTSCITIVDNDPGTCTVWLCSEYGWCTHNAASHFHKV